MLEIQRHESNPVMCTRLNVNHEIQVKRGREVGITSLRPSLASHYNNNHMGEASVYYECKGVIITQGGGSGIRSRGKRETRDGASSRPERGRGIGPPARITFPRYTVQAV